MLEARALRAHPHQCFASDHQCFTSLNIMDKTFINHQKEKLLAKKGEIERLLSLRSVRDSHDTANFDPLFPDYGDKEEDNAEEVVQFEKNIAVDGYLEESLKAVNAALVRITDGTYGICTVTGKPIPQQRLEAMPEAATIAGV